MTPQVLEQYLKAARQGGCMALTLKTADFEMAFSLGPETLQTETFGNDPTPGGWKAQTPQFLDAPAEDYSIDGED